MEQHKDERSECHVLSACSVSSRPRVSAPPSSRRLPSPHQPTTNNKPTDHRRDEAQSEQDRRFGVANLEEKTYWVRSRADALIGALCLTMQRQKR
jgi:hypothetical protein